MPDRRLNRSAVGLVVLGAAVGCSSYPASDRALDAMKSDDAVVVEQVGDLTAFLPVSAETDRAVVFYPGAKVEPEAYAPLLHLLAAEGVSSVLVSMPSDLAVLAPNKGDRAIEEFQELGPWYAAGHSLGGAMAASWFSKNGDTMKGLALLAAYPASSVDLSSIEHPVVSITASEDEVLDLQTWRERKANLPDTTRYVEIDGGNHAGFGSYGPQDGDGRATICQEEQWAQTVAAMIDMIVGPEDAD